MYWFKDVAWNDIALAAVACLSPLGVWVPFWFDHRQKTRDRRQRQVGELERLRLRLRDDIEPWANEWPENSYNPQWYLPGTEVFAFQWRHVESFNRLVMAGDYPQELAVFLVRLEEAARRFHAVLTEQNEFRRRVPAVVTQNLQPVFAAALARTTPLLDAEIAMLSPGLGEGGRHWVQNLYLGNRRIHVEAIGHQGRRDGLFESFRAAVSEIDRVQRRLQAARDPWWYLGGHALAGVLALTGLLFLGDFWSSFVGERLHHRAAASPTSADSTFNSHDTSHVGSPAAKPPSPSPSSSSMQPR